MMNIGILCFNRGMKKYFEAFRLSLRNCILKLRLHCDDLFIYHNHGCKTYDLPLHRRPYLQDLVYLIL